MARYIDADRFKSNLEKAMENMHVIGGVKAVGMEAVIEALNKQPTADVVPKSEYDEVLSSWQKIHDSYDADCIEHYKYGRAEVAREFAEEVKLEFYREFDEIIPSIMADKIDGLVKKYTEEK